MWDQFNVSPNGRHMSDFNKVICGTCNVDPEFVEGADGVELLCLSCGRRDNVTDALRIAGEYLSYESARSLRGSTARITGKEATGLEPGSEAKRKFRWHAA